MIRSMIFYQREYRNLRKELKVDLSIEKDAYGEGYQDVMRGKIGFADFQICILKWKRNDIQSCHDVCRMDEGEKIVLLNRVMEVTLSGFINTSLNI